MNKCGWRVVMLAMGLCTGAVLVLGAPSMAWADDAGEDGAMEAAEDAAEQQVVEATERASEAAGDDPAVDSKPDGADGVEVVDEYGDGDGEHADAGAGRQLAEDETEVPGGVFVIITYLVLWLMLGGFVVVMLVRQKRLQGQLDDLEHRIDDLLGGA